jgi:hypothetical protein
MSQRVLSPNTAAPEAKDSATRPTAQHARQSGISKAKTDNEHRLVISEVVLTVAQI